MSPATEAYLKDVQTWQRQQSSSTERVAHHLSASNWQQTKQIAAGAVKTTFRVAELAASKALFFTAAVATLAPAPLFIVASPFALLPITDKVYQSALNTYIALIKKEASLYEATTDAIWKPLSRSAADVANGFEILFNNRNTRREHLADPVYQEVANQYDFENVTEYMTDSFYELVSLHHQQRAKNNEIKKLINQLNSGQNLTPIKQGSVTDTDFVEMAENFTSKAIQSKQFAQLLERKKEFEALQKQIDEHPCNLQQPQNVSEYVQVTLDAPIETPDASVEPQQTAEFDVGIALQAIHQQHVDPTPSLLEIMRQLQTAK